MDVEEKLCENAEGNDVVRNGDFTHTVINGLIKGGEHGSACTTVIFSRRTLQLHWFTY
jgi:hypothetical protein